MNKVIRVVDLETTGSGPEALVCEVGWSDLGPEGPTPPVSHLCRVEHMPPEIRAVHHIKASDTADARPFTSDMVLAPGVTAFAAHNASFEAQFIAFASPLICTYKAALRVWPEAPSHGNAALAYWLEDQGLASIDLNHALPSHRAGPDAYVTAHILQALIAAGTSIEDMVRWASEPGLLPRCTIGKFRGVPWRDVDEGYLDWMLRQDGMADDLQHSARIELKRRSEAQEA